MEGRLCGTELAYGGAGLLKRGGGTEGSATDGETDPETQRQTDTRKQQRPAAAPGSRSLPKKSSPTRW
eukprot:3461138-Rhodomonas_salina.1